MTVLTIELIDPRAKILLEGLAELKLINIQEKREAPRSFSALVHKLRAKAEEAPDLKEITAEVEQVRSDRKTESE
ncbi:MAG: hypothetical protein AAF399_04715 [Bacteroidota bacterium]